MFGWEFPPHISGGLGTACYGLTKSLVKLDVQVLFVVPKLFGGENLPRVDFIDAGKVPLTKKHVNNTIKSVLADHELSTYEKFSTITIESSLSPYGVIQETNSPIETWNYILNTSVEKTETTMEETTESDEIFTYSFSGSYGQNLLAETQRYATVARALTKDHDFDVIHAHDWMTFPAGIAAKEQSGKPLIVHVHATEVDRSGEHVNPLVFAIEQEGMQKADRVFAVSNWTKEILVSRYNINADKIEILHNGIIPKTPTTEKVKQVIGTHVVTFVGRLTYQKGPFYFIEAARRVLEKFPDAHFVMAGSGDLFPRVLEKVAHLNLSSRFHFTGFLTADNIEKIWAVSDVYVMPSVSEPFGITPLEAIQSGVPVIVSNQSGVAEVMPHAIKIDFWRTDELANAICNVLAYDSLSKTLRENSRAEIENITWDRAATKINAIYHELS